MMPLVIAAWILAGGLMVSGVLMRAVADTAPAYRATPVGDEAQPVGFGDGPTPWRAYLDAAVWIDTVDGRLAIHECPDAALALADAEGRSQLADMAPMHARLTAGMPLAWTKIRGAGLDAALADDPATLSVVLRALMAYDLEHSADAGELLRGIEGGGPVVVDADVDGTCASGPCQPPCACPSEQWEYCGCMTFEWIDPRTWRCALPRATCEIKVPRQ
jgi:hypothetical protein